jgi:hypothetical protein
MGNMCMVVCGCGGVICFMIERMYNVCMCGAGGLHGAACVGPGGWGQGVACVGLICCVHICGHWCTT